LDQSFVKVSDLIDNITSHALTGRAEIIAIHKELAKVLGCVAADGCPQKNRIPVTRKRSTVAVYDPRLAEDAVQRASFKSCDLQFDPVGISDVVAAQNGYVSAV
jgi:hypothetical protein